MLFSHPLRQRVALARRPIRGMMHHRRRRNDEQILFKRNQTSTPFFPFSSLSFLHINFNQRVRFVGFFPTRHNALFVRLLPFAHEKLFLRSFASICARQVIQNNLFVRFLLVALVAVFLHLLSVSSFQLLPSSRREVKTRRQVPHVVPPDRASHSPPSVVLVVERRKARRVDQHLVSPPLRLSSPREVDARKRMETRSGRERERKSNFSTRCYFCLVFLRRVQKIPLDFCVWGISRVFLLSCFSPFFSMLESIHS